MEELHTDSIDEGYEANYGLGHAPGRGWLQQTVNRRHPAVLLLFITLNMQKAYLPMARAPSGWHPAKRVPTQGALPGAFRRVVSGVAPYARAT